MFGGRSREARRLKENQIALRAAFLEKENKMLKRVRWKDLKEEGQKERQKRRHRSSLLFGGRTGFNSFAALAIFRQGDVKKRRNRITATWRNVCFGKG